MRLKLFTSLCDQLRFAAKIALPEFSGLSASVPREPSEEVRLQRSHAAGHMNQGGLQLTAPSLPRTCSTTKNYTMGMG